MNVIWQIKNFKVLPLLYQIGYRNNLKPGQSLGFDEYLEAWNRHPDWLEPLGTTNLDHDQLVGELREAGKKVFSTREYKRQRKLRDDTTDDANS